MIEYPLGDQLVDQGIVASWILTISMLSTILIRVMTLTYVVAPFMLVDCLHYCTEDIRIVAYVEHRTPKSCFLMTNMSLVDCKLVSSIRDSRMHASVWHVPTNSCVQIPSSAD